MHKVKYSIASNKVEKCFIVHVLLTVWRRKTVKFNEVFVFEHGVEDSAQEE